MDFEAKDLKSALADLAETTGFALGSHKQTLENAEPIALKLENASLYDVLSLLAMQTGVKLQKAWRLGLAQQSLREHADLAALPAR